MTLTQIAAHVRVLELFIGMVKKVAMTKCMKEPILLTTSSYPVRCSRETDPQTPGYRMQGCLADFKKPFLWLV